jgi:hypothetical protein
MRNHLAFILTAVTFLLAAPTSANAAFGLNEFDVGFTNAQGRSSLDAGSHPSQITVSFNVNSTNGVDDGQPRDVLTSQVPGLVGNPTAVPPCATADFLTRAVNAHGDFVPACPDSAAVGLVEIELGNSGGGGGAATAAVFSLEPPPGVAAKLGFWVLGVPVAVELGVSESPPYNVIGGPTNISQVLEVLSAKFTLWGVPADPVHDPLRGICLKGDGGSSGNCPAKISVKPFLTLPRACEGPLRTGYEAFSWQGDADAGGALTHDDAGVPQGMANCDELAFGPRISTQPTNRSAEAPTGLDVDVRIKDEGLVNPTGTAASDIKKTVLTLPEGVTINPSQAEGLGVCTEEDLTREKLGSAFGTGCPSSSKIGSLEAESPLLEGRVLRGSLFVAKPYDNRFGSLIAVFMVLREPERGVIVKLAAKVEPDPRTGQLVSTVDDLPQLPVSRFHLHFREGGRSPLVTPARCGVYETTAAFTPYANPTTPYVATSSFRVESGVDGGPCPGGTGQPFEPGFDAGTVSNSAGLYSPMLLHFTRRDGDQDLTRFDVTLPPGLTAKLAGVSRCSDLAIAAARAKSGKEELASPSCPASSRIGSVNAGAGVGSQLTYVPGSVYLAGPFAGAPLSVVAVVPAVAGPFDVGTVVTRQALVIDPNTAQAAVDGSLSEPIPHILAGIPLRVRDIQVDVDRPEFSLNPTSCDPYSVNAAIWGGGSNVFSAADDSPVPRSAPFQAANCSRLGFQPRLSLQLRGGTERGDHPALRSVLTPRVGDANIGRAIVTLPPSEFIDNAHIQNPCTRVQFGEGACPMGSVLGRARAFTPLLDRPLEGPVYFRSNGGARVLPDVVADLRGEFHIVLVGFVDAKNARIRTTFASVPDAPTSKFVLNLNGGKRGLLVNNRDLCARRLRVSLRLVGQNSDVSTSNPTISTSCGDSQRRPKSGAGQHDQRK